MPRLQKLQGLEIPPGPPISFVRCFSKAFEDDEVHNMGEEERYLVVALRAYGYKFGYEAVYTRAKQLWDSGDHRPISITFFAPIYDSEISDKPRTHDPNNPEKEDRWESFRYHSREFTAIYRLGEFYTDFYAWMMTPYDIHLIHTTSQSFLGIVDDMRFMWLCVRSHQMAENKGVKGLNVLQLESAWARLVIGKFEAVFGKTIQTLIGSEKYPNLHTENDVRSWLKQKLFRCFEMYVPNRIEK
jgi:hypothetical protein